MDKIHVLGYQLGVTPSGIISEFGDHVILFDFGCGFDKGENAAPDGLMKPDMTHPLLFTKDLKVVISHGHFDHYGALMDLFKLRKSQGLETVVYMTRPTAALLLNAYGDPIDIARRKGEIPPFSEEDLMELGHSVIMIDRPGWHDMGLNFRSHWDPNGHIRGSARVTFETTRNGFRRRITFTGDESFHDTPTVLGGSMYIADDGVTDVLVTEATNGARVRANVLQEMLRLSMFASEVTARRGILLVLAFKVARAQDMVRRFIELGFSVGLDGGAKRIAELYADEEEGCWSGLDVPFDYEGLKNPSDSSYPRVVEIRGKTRQFHLDSRTPSVIVTPSGMGQGLAAGYLEQLLSDARNGVALVGYAAEKTNSRIVQDAMGKPKGTVVTLEVDRPVGGGNGSKSMAWETVLVDVPVHADIGKFDFSSHAGGDELAKSVVVSQAQKVIAVHCEESGFIGLRDRMRQHPNAPELVLGKHGSVIEI